MKLDSKLMSSWVPFYW